MITGQNRCISIILADIGHFFVLENHIISEVNALEIMWFGLLHPFLDSLASLLDGCPQFYA